MNRDTALEKLEEALKGHIPAFEERMSEAATFVDHVGACLVSAFDSEMRSIHGIEEVRPGTYWTNQTLPDTPENMSKTTQSSPEGYRFLQANPHADGGALSAHVTDGGPPDRPAGITNEPRQEAIELLLKLEGTSPSLFEIYQIDYGQNGESPSVKGMKPLAHDWAIPLFVLEAALAMVEEGLVDQIIHLILEEAAVEILMENLAPECSKWSDRLVDENERWL